MFRRQPAAWDASHFEGLGSEKQRGSGQVERGRVRGVWELAVQLEVTYRHKYTTV